MLILALSVCLAQDPATCKVVQLPFFAEHIPASQCTRYGEPEAERWLKDHPGWILRKSMCVPSSASETAA